MAEDWLPPRAPAHPPDTALPRGPGRMPQRPRLSRAPTRPAELVALGLGTASVFVTLFSAGMLFALGAIFGLLGLGLGRHTGRRSAIVLAWVGLAVACAGGFAWSLLAYH